jgi:hypothetical protein
VRKLLALLLLLCGGLSSVARGSDSFFRDEREVGSIRDGYRPTKIWWSGWKVSSSEDLWDGCTRSSFPLTYLFDGDPNTIWAYSGTSQRWRRGGWRGRYGLSIWMDKPVALDELWLMNGYNKRRDLFLRNDRIVEMQIWVNDKKEKTVRLSDDMGWHKIALPDRIVQHIGLIFTGIRKGQGTDNDVCVSELALLHRGRKINMKMPEVVMFEDGNRSGDAPLDCALMARNGKVITQGTLAMNGRQEEEWSPSRRYVCALWRFGKAGTILLWVADTRAQRIIKRFYLPQQRNDDLYRKDLLWIENETVEVRWMDYDLESDTETIKHHKEYQIR